MAYSTITNEKRIVVLDCSESPHETPSYARLGEGINTFTPSNNGQISTKHYINDKFATSRRNGLQKQWAFSGDRLKSPEWRRFIQISLPLWQKVPVM